MSSTAEATDSAWGTADLAEALPTPENNDSGAADEQDETRATDGGATAEEIARAKEHGWGERTAFDYEALGADREAAAALEQSGALPSWAHNAARYEWLDEYGDVAPALPELEDDLFGRSREHTSEAGEHLKTYSDFTVLVEGPETVRPVTSFKDAGLHPQMLANLNLCKYKTPTPVQAYSIPAVLTGNDLVSVAQTGSGKTAAYLIPIISRLMGKAKKLAAPRPNPTRYTPADACQAQPLVLIVCPTRELAMQIFDDARRMCYRSMLRPCVAYGGAPRRDQLEELKRGCDVLIGTPGRLNDFVTTEARWLSLERLKYTVLDEADEMIQEDWEEAMKHLLGGGASSMEGDHQFLLFSATFPARARSLAKKYLADDNIRISVGRVGSTHMNIRQDIIWAESDMKNKALYDLLLDLPPCRTLIFVNSWQKADIVDDFLFNMALPVTSIHSNRTQREREDAIRSFRGGKVPIMVATGVSARGLDIRHVMHVINYDLPSTDHGGITEYVHRIGRTARIGNAGQATSFFNDRDASIGPDLVKLLLEAGQPIPDILEQYKPDGELTWDDDKSEDDEGDAGVEVAGEAGEWGADESTDAPAITEAADDALGSGGGGWEARAAATSIPAVEAW